MHLVSACRQGWQDESIEHCAERGGSERGPPDSDANAMKRESAGRSLLTPDSAAVAGLPGALGVLLSSQELWKSKEKEEEEKKILLKNSPSLTTFQLKHSEHGRAVTQTQKGFRNRAAN